ncbi:MAG: hypothetical protein J6331_08695 [Lentisphaeria bacterium]|nr:hypothetical protein [Lentisphaeria bacterium]
MDPTEGREKKNTGGNDMFSAPSFSAGKRRYPSPGSLLFFLLAAVLFHILFFLLFRPMAKERRAQSPGKGFILFLSEEKKEELVREYGLGYFLTYFDPARAKKMEKEYGFTAWERFFSPSPLPEAMTEYSEGTVPPVPRTREETLLAHPRTLAELTETAPMNVPLHAVPPRPDEGPPVQIKGSDFPFWHFSTGQKVRGLPSGLPGNGEILRKFRDKASGSTRFRIAFAGRDLPPELTLLKSCGSEELDRLARQELYGMLGAPFREEKRSLPPAFFCTVVWSEALLAPEKASPKISPRNGQKKNGKEEQKK